MLDHQVRTTQNTMYPYNYFITVIKTGNHHRADSIDVYHRDKTDGNIKMIGGFIAS